MNKYVSTILSILLVFALPCHSQRQERRIKEIIERSYSQQKAQVGIAVIINGEDTITLNNKVRYP